MKDPKKLQSKLRDLLKNTDLDLGSSLDEPLTVGQLEAVAKVVADYVDRDPGVINADPLKDWVEEYRFFRADFRV